MVNHLESIDDVLVTGGAGFIGSHLTDQLMQKRRRVTIVDNLSLEKKGCGSARVLGSNPSEMLQTGCERFDVRTKLKSREKRTIYLFISARNLKKPLKSTYPRQSEEHKKK